MELYKGKYQYYYHNNAKSAHYITSFQLKIYSTRPGSSLIPSQIEKINKRIMMMTTNIPPSPSLISFIIGINNTPNTNRIIILLSSPPFSSKPEKDKNCNQQTQVKMNSSLPHISLESFQHRRNIKNRINKIIIHLYRPITFLYFQSPSNNSFLIIILRLQLGHLIEVTSQRNQTS